MGKPIPKPADPIRDRRHIKAIKSMLKADEERVKYLFFTVGINSGLRVSDLLDLRVGDLWTPEGEPRREFSTRAQKTGSLAITQINQAVREAMTFAEPDVPTYDPDAILFQVSRQMVSRWVKKWAHQVGIDRGTYSAYSPA